MLRKDDSPTAGPLALGCRRALLLQGTVLRRALLVLFALLSVAGVTAPASHAAACGLQSGRPLWIDIPGGPFYKKIWAKRGLTVAVGSISKTGAPDVPSTLYAAGAKLAHWDLYLKRRVGTPTAPNDPATMVDRANKLFDYAVQVTRCPTPAIGENELFGASTPTPWTPQNAQYRQNVLVFLRQLAARGATPYLAVSSVPYTAGEAGDWWREVSKVAHIVREVYLPAPMLYGLGPIEGNRYLRKQFRRAVADLAVVGVPTSRIGLMLGFQTTRGFGGREGLKPAQAWFRTVKWQALSAKTVAAEMKIGSIWSWGWSSWSNTPQEMDPDKEGAACVYLWASRRACNGPAAAGKGFKASLTEGQLLGLGSDVYCRLGRDRITNGQIRRVATVTGDSDLARTLLFGRIVLRQQEKVAAARVRAAERAVVAGAFGGKRANYLAAVREQGATPRLGRDGVADELRRRLVESRFRVRAPSSVDVRDYYRTYGDVLGRRVAVKTVAPWLGGKRTGVALQPLVAPQILSLRAGGWRSVETATGRYQVRALGSRKPLRRFPLAAAAPSIRAALREIARSDAFDQWLLRAENRALRRAICWRDDLPSPGTATMRDFLPFLDSPF
jgi:hypothetical protein